MAWCSREESARLRGGWIARVRAACLGQLSLLGRLASLPRLALSKNSDSNPPRRVPRINAGNPHVSRLLWLIVALQALSVKSACGSDGSFGRQRNSLPTRAFSAPSQGLDDQERCVTAPCSTPLFRHPTLIATAACIAVFRSVFASAVNCQQRACNC